MLLSRRRLEDVVDSPPSSRTAAGTSCVVVSVRWSEGGGGSSGPGHRGVHQRQQDGREEGRHANARADPCHARGLAGALLRSLPRLVGCEGKYHTILLIRLLII